MENEIYSEVQNEPNYDEYTEDLTFSDYFLLSFITILACAVFAFIVKTISKYLKNMHLKLGNKIEIGVESKEDTNKTDK